MEGIELWDSLPPKTRGGTRTSKWPDKLQAVVDSVVDEDGQFEDGARVVALLEKYGVEDYKDPSGAAASAAVQLREKYGNLPEVNGFRFHVSKIGDSEHGVFAVYEPGKIKPGYAEVHDKEYKRKMAERLEKSRAKEEAKKAKETARV